MHTHTHACTHTHSQELEGEMAEKVVVLQALTATGQNIQDEMESKGAPPSEISDQLLDIRGRWDALSSRLSVQVTRLGRGVCADPTEG